MSAPADFVDAIINNALTTAEAQTSYANTAANATVSASQGFAIANPPDIAYTITAIEPTPLPVDDAVLIYESQRDQLIALLSGKLADFFTTFYPLATDAFTPAINWLINSITLGGTGIAPAVEAQIWQRDRDRVIAEGQRIEAQTYSEFASRGFSLPAGAMATRLQEARFAQLTMTQGQSRDVAVKQAELEIENVRFAVGEAIKARTAALSAATDYIRALMSGPDIATRVASLNIDAKARMLSATSDLYRVRLSRDELAMKVPLVNSDTHIRAQLANLDGFYKGVSARVDATGHAADVYGRTAQAALASLTSIAGTTVSAFA